MRERDALRAARKFVRCVYPAYGDYFIDICEESIDGRAKSWSFGVYLDDGTDPLIVDGTKEAPQLVGYVHADGTVEGLY